MTVQRSNVQYRVTPEQLDELRDALDDLDESVRSVRRNAERLDSLRHEIRTQPVGVSAEK